MEKYYLHLDNEQKGPFTLAQLQEMWKTGAIGPKTQFWTKAAGEWQALETMQDEIEPPRAPTAASPLQPPGIASPVAAATAAKVAEAGTTAAAPASHRTASETPLREERMGNPFPVLTAVSILLRVVGWLGIIAGMVLVFYAAYNASGNGNALLPLIPGLLLVGYSLGVVVAGEVLGVLFAIEANTRRTAMKTTAMATRAAMRDYGR